MFRETLGLASNGIPLVTKRPPGRFPVKKTSFFPVEKSSGFPVVKQNTDVMKIKGGISLKGEQKDSDKELKKVTQDFEAIFLRQLLKVMRGTIPESGFLAGSNSMSIYESMMDEVLAQNAAEMNKTGLGEQIYNYLIRNRSQENKELKEVDKSAYIYIEKVKERDRAIE